MYSFNSLLIWINFTWIKVTTRIKQSQMWRVIRACFSVTQSHAPFYYSLTDWPLIGRPAQLRLKSRLFYWQPSSWKPQYWINLWPQGTISSHFLLKSSNQRAAVASGGVSLPWSRLLRLNSPNSSTNQITGAVSDPTVLGGVGRLVAASGSRSHSNNTFYIRR